MWSPGSALRVDSQRFGFALVWHPRLGEHLSGLDNQCMIGLGIFSFSNNKYHGTAYLCGTHTPLKTKKRGADLRLVHRFNTKATIAVENGRWRWVRAGMEYSI